MAGFFGLFDYSKPGPGVEKDAPPKARIIVFFEVFTRKFWNLIKINLMFNIFNIPAVILGLLAVMFIVGDLPGVDLTDPSMAALDILFKFGLTSVVLCIPVITVGPAQAGLTYLLRNYAREEHAFLWGDFKENALKNFKQSIAVSIIDFFAFILMLFSMKFYFLYDGGLATAMAGGLALLAFLIFFMMHIYIYPMMVTFKLSLKQLYKNALIFAFIKFFPNLGILLLCTALILVFYIFVSPVIALILYLLITVSLVGLITNFFAYPKLKKYIMDKLEDAEAEDETEEDENTEPDAEQET